MAKTANNIRAWTTYLEGFPRGAHREQAEERKKKGRSTRCCHHDGFVTSVAFLPDGKRVLSASADKTIKLWNTNGTLLKTFSGHRAKINSIAISPDGQKILSGGADQTIRLWDLEQGAEQTKFPMQDKEINSVAFSPDGQWILSGDSSGIAKLWSVSGDETYQYPKLDGGVTGVAFSHDSSFVFVAGCKPSVNTDSGSQSSEDGCDGAMIKLWKRSDGTPIRQFVVDGAHKNGAISGYIPTAIAVSKESEYLLTGTCTEAGEQAGCKKASVVLFAVRQGAILRTISIESASNPTTVAFSPDGRYFLAGACIKFNGTQCVKGTIHAWPMEGEQYIKPMNGIVGGVNSVAFSPDGLLAVSGGDDAEGRLWDLTELE